LEVLIILYFLILLNICSNCSSSRKIW